MRLSLTSGFFSPDEGWGMPSRTTRYTATRKRLPLKKKKKPTPVALWLSGALLSIAAFSSSWTAATIGGFNIVDYALAASTVVALLAWLVKDRTIIVEGWMLLPTIGAVLVWVADVFLTEGISIQAVDITRLFLSTTLVAIFARSEAEAGGPARTMRLVKWWAAGIIVNGLVAVLVDQGFIVTTGILIQPTGERLSGLSSHPNSIAFSISIALPVLVYLFTRGAANRRQRFLWLVGLAISIAALLLADSRAGLIVGLSALALALLIALRHGRMRKMAVPIIVLASIAVWQWVLPALLGTRLAAGAGDLSNVGRVQFNAAALEVFTSSPFWGGGFDAQSGVSVPVQVLSAGGLLLAITYYLFLLIPTARIWSERKNLIAQYGVIVVIAILGYGLLNPVFSERAAFWVPLLFAAGLAAQKTRDQAAAQEP